MSCELVDARGKDVDDGAGLLDRRGESRGDGADIVNARVERSCHERAVCCGERA